MKLTETEIALHYSELASDGETVCGICKGPWPCDSQVFMVAVKATAESLRELRSAAASVVAGIDQWNEDVFKAIGRPVDYSWGDLERLRAAVAEAEKL